MFLHTGNQLGIVTPDSIRNTSGPATCNALATKRRWTIVRKLTGVTLASPITQHQWALPLPVEAVSVSADNVSFNTVHFQ